MSLYIAKRVYYNWNNKKLPAIISKIWDTNDDYSGLSLHLFNSGIDEIPFQFIEAVPYGLNTQGCWEYNPYVIDEVLNSTQHGQLNGGDLHTLATQTTAGFLSPTDKTKLDNLSTSSTNSYTTITDGVASASPNNSTDTFTFRSANNKLSLTLSSNDATYGDNLLLSLQEININHNNLLNHISNEHINHSTIEILGGVGLIGGGNLTDSRTLSLGTPSSITTTSINTTSGTTHTHEITGFTPTTRTISTSTGLTGGGDLSANRTLALVNTAVTPGTYTYPTITVDAQGRLTSASNTTITSGRFIARWDVANGPAQEASFGSGLSLSSTTGVLTVNSAQVDHNALSNYVANRHIDHSAVSISAGVGLSGGGDLTTTRTLSLGVPSSITTTSTNSVSGVTHTHAITGFVPDIRTISPGTGLSGGGDLTANRTLSLANTTVTAGNYTLANFTVDAQGRLTAASSTSVVPIVNGGTGSATRNFVDFTSSDSISGTKSFSTINASSVNITGGGLSVSGVANATFTNGSINLNNTTSNLISYSANGLGNPTLTTRSIGTKLTLYPSLSASFADYAIGIGTNNSLWFSIPTNTGTFDFQWYGGTNLIANLGGNGTLDLVGGLTLGQPLTPTYGGLGSAVTPSIGSILVGDGSKYNSGTITNTDGQLTINSSASGVIINTGPKALGQVLLATSITTNLTTYGVMSGLTYTVNPSFVTSFRVQGNVLVSTGTATRNIQIAIFVNGTEDTNTTTTVRIGATNVDIPIVIERIYQSVNTSTTYDIRWRVSGSASTFTSTRRTFIVQEL